uniref:Reverse transcriptase zinc-binding domain-containing protein n=1 Tax=Trichuris muris TaxID=70415 RepID=A0A5S6Q6B2_TRIMR
MRVCQCYGPERQDLEPLSVAMRREDLQERKRWPCAVEHADLADQRVRCRRCGNISGAPESLAHISQTCMFTHGLITRRHDAVVDKIASIAIDAGYDSLREPILRCDGQTWKPDLVPYKGENSFIVDVAIPYESKEPLARRHHEKCRKYERLKATVCTLTKTKNCATGAIIIGARGAWCPRNDESLKLANINIKYRQKALLCLTVLERTNKIISWFMQASEELQPRIIFWPSSTAALTEALASSGQGRDLCRRSTSALTEALASSVQGRDGSRMPIALCRFR